MADNIQWSQEIGGVKVPIAEIASSTCSRPVMERKVRPQKDQALNCPRCHSTNTKFCYYNNYSLTQPRYFCKTCRRYWTEGGTLRNVPVGGGSRKNKRSCSSSSSVSSQKLPDLNPSNISQFSSPNPKIHEGQDLNLGFPSLFGASQFFELPKIESSSSSSSQMKSTEALELLRTTGVASREMNMNMNININMNNNSFMATTPTPDLNSIYSSGFSFQDLKPGLGFALDGIGSRFGPSGVQENSGRSLIFPFGGFKQISGTSEVVDDQNKGQQNSNGYWNGMLGGGPW